MAIGRLRGELDQNDTDLTGVKRMRSFPSFSSAFTEAVVTVLRKVVHEEVHSRVLPYVASLQRPSQLRIGEVEASSNWRLVFTRPILPQIYTKSKVEDQDNRPLQVKLVDTRTGESPALYPRSALKVEVVVLNGDFPSRDDDDWTAEEFNRNVVKQREGRAQLLVGDRKVAVCEGMASFEDLEFTDNSSWVRSGRFIFGVRVAPGSYEGPRIKEAVTKPFKVLDRRGESYKKHNPPRPHDEVWRLKKIAKDGVFHRSLRDANVRTVREFLRLLNNDRNALRGILKGMTDKAWKAAVRHAMTCSHGEDQFPPCQGHQQTETVSSGGHFAMQQVNSATQGLPTTTRYQEEIVIPPNNVQTESSMLIEDIQFDLYNGLISFTGSTQLDVDYPT
ncbi:calmodulin-binding protein 60 D isoform X2 [Musa acuminata AAA Group]|uniref:calmodulin-binding protein 60 D isoform X2 n=1 Tax=Musa acuminata AAA Group TaxID=214697 RepID=UPI0031DB464A